MTDRWNMSRVIFNLALFVLSVTIAFLTLSGCSRGQEQKERNPIFLDQYKFYILDSGDFEVVEPEYPIPKEFLRFDLDGIEVSAGGLQDMPLTEGNETADVTVFALETIQDTGWLAGVNRWMLDTREVTIDGRWFYVVTVLVRRDPEWTSRLTYIQRVTSRHELERFENNVDYIVRLYYTLSDSDLHIFTLSGQPEDIVIYETEVRRLLSNFRGDAAEAQTALEYGGSG
jgi:hypothetical protein